MAFAETDIWPLRFMLTANQALDRIVNFSRGKKQQLRKICPLTKRGSPKTVEEARR